MAVLHPTDRDRAGLQKELKSDICPVRPIYHQKDARIEAHIFVAFIGVLPSGNPQTPATRTGTGINPEEPVLEKFAAMQMVDMFTCLPPTGATSSYLATHNPTRISASFCLR